MAACSEDKTWSLWEVDSKGGKMRGLVENTHFRAIYSISWSQSNNFVATGGGDNQIFVHKIAAHLLDQGSEVKIEPTLVAKVAQAHFNDINCVAFSPKKDSLVLGSCSDDCSIKLWTIIEQADSKEIQDAEMEA